MKFDSYTLKARILPALLSAIPFFVLHFYYLSPTLGQFWGAFLALKIGSGATLLIAFVFLLVQLSRFFSKHLFENRVFADGYQLPTTDHLLHADSHYSPEYTKQIHARIKLDFGILIPSERQELADVHRSRQVISEAVSHIRQKVGAGNLTAQHNAEYGFIRNLAGGSIIAVLVSILNIVVFWVVSSNRIALAFSIVLAVLYSTILFLSTTLIRAFGYSYAKILIQEYMALSRTNKNTAVAHKTLSNRKKPSTGSVNAGGKNDPETTL